jgi:hypothetical protein
LRPLAVNLALLRRDKFVNGPLQPQHGHPSAHRPAVCR